MIDLATTALHGDRILAKALTTYAPWARRAIGLDVHDTRPVIAIVANATTQTLVPLTSPNSKHWIALETNQFIKEISLATTAEETARIGRDWLAHGAIRPLLVAPHPLGHINEHWTVRPDIIQHRKHSLLPHRSETDVQATAQGNVGILVQAPDVDIELKESHLWATRGGNGVRITHPRTGEALAKLGKNAGQTDPALLTLIARFGEIGIAVAENTLAPARASAWARIGLTPTQTAETINTMGIGIVDLKGTRCSNDELLQDAFASLGLNTRIQAADAELIWILVDNDTCTLERLQRIQQGLLGPQINWAICTITGGSITVTTGRGTQPRTLTDAALAHAEAPANVALDPEHLVATAISAIAHSPCTGMRARFRIPHAATSKQRKQTLRFIEGTHWTRSRTQLLRRAVGSIKPSAATTTKTPFPILLTEKIERTAKLEAQLDGDEAAWCIVLKHWTGWAIISRPKGHAGPCPQCIALRLNNAGWGSSDAKHPYPAESNHEKNIPGEQIARAIEPNTTRMPPQATVSWLDPQGRLLAPVETIGVQHRCPRCTHRKEPTHSPNRWPRHGPWTGSLVRSQAIDGKFLAAGNWAYVHRTRRCLRWTHAVGLAGGAADATADGARKRAEAEAAERHATEWHQGQHRNSPHSAHDFKRAGIRHVTPAALAPFSETQHKLRDSINGAGHRHVRIPAAFGLAEHHIPIHWHIGTDLTTPTPEDVWLPEEWTFIGAPPPLGQPTDRTLNRRFCVADTNGCASGTTFETAAARAFTELVERDACALWWYTRTIRPEIALEKLGDPWLNEALARYRTIGRTIKMLDATTTPTIKVAIAVSCRRTPLQDGSWDPVISSGAGPNTVAASRAALREHIHTGPRTSDPHHSWYERSPTPESQTLRRLDPEQAPWLYDKTETLPISQPEQTDETPDLNQALGAARELTASLIAIDLTLSPLDPFVVRVASPELCHPWHRLGHPRLSTGPRDAGWTDKTFEEQELNPVPLVM